MLLDTNPARPHGRIGCTIIHRDGSLCGRPVATTLTRHSGRIALAITACAEHAARYPQEWTRADAATRQSIPVLTDADVTAAIAAAARADVRARRRKPAVAAFRARSLPAEHWDTYRAAYEAALENRAIARDEAYRQSLTRGVR